MERDWDIIRDILLRLEEMESHSGVLASNEWEEDQRRLVSYNVQLMLEAGLLTGRVMTQADPQDFIAHRMTWDGHDFLDAIRSDTIWRKTKNRFLSEGVTMTFDLIKRMALQLANQQLGLG